MHALFHMWKTYMETFGLPQLSTDSHNSLMPVITYMEIYHISCSIRMSPKPAQYYSASWVQAQDYLGTYLSHTFFLMQKR